VKFLPGSTGVLILDNSAAYHGTISGFDATNSSVIDLADIEKATETATFMNGQLLIQDAHGHSAKITIAGSHTSAVSNSRPTPTAARWSATRRSITAPTPSRRARHWKSRRRRPAK